MNTNQTPSPLIWLACLYILSLPFNGFSFLNLTGRAILRPDWFLAIILTLLMGIYIATNRIKIGSSPINKFVLIYVYTSLLGVINLFNASNSQFIDFGTVAAQLILVVSVFFVFSSLQVNEERLRMLIKVWIVCAFTVSLYAIYQAPARTFDLPAAYLTLSNPTTAPGAIQSVRVFEAYEFAQVTSVFREPTWLGSYLLSPLIVAATLLIHGRSRLVLFKSKIINWLMLTSIVLAIVLSVALGSYISLMVAVTFMFIYGRYDRTALAKFMLGFVLAVLLSVLAFILLDINILATISTRLQALIQSVHSGGNVGTSLGNRLERTRAALAVWLDHPIFGVGLNNTHYYTPEDITLINNGWAQTLSSQGIIGFLALLAIFGSLLRNLTNLLNRIDRSTWWYFLILGLTVAILSDMIDTIVTFNWTHPIRWFTISIANLVYITANRRFPSTIKHEVTQLRFRPMSIDPQL